ncbi:MULTISPECIES: DUF748 domain-containing protein [Idiomarina]|uniref:DUF748 domain-containing protein n=1 Tax=Idiomarina TaxID=135575 RepID=UPI000C3943D8|nr:MULTISPECIES: DUF748 domain-containing protein [Idiomarina]MBP58712.1 hypothetical protein [Idiomarina sp.]|tara:strand:- start:12 stop:2336 length:2325 start_codon:yes stop_codon:yes gene_type:complete
MHTGSLHRFGSYLKTRWASPRRIRFWLIVLVTLYTLLGFFALPLVIQYVAVNTAKEDFDRELRIESVQTNPYTLTLQINGLELDDVDKQQLLGWERLFIDLTWASITNQAWTFETIHLDKPTIQEERFTSGETRFSRLASENTGTEPKESEPAQLPALEIRKLNVERGVLRFADNLKNSEKTEQVSLALQSIGVSVQDFTLQKDASFPLRLDAQFDEGGEVNFDGQLQVLPTFALEGSTSINELALAQAEPYLQQFMNVRLNSGNLTLNGKMQTDAQQPFAFQGSAGISSLSIREGTKDEPLIGWQTLETQQLNLNLSDKQFESAAITIEGLSGRVVIYEDKTTNFGQLVTQPPETTDSKNEDTDPFSITIEAIELADGSIHFADNSLPLPFSTRIHTLNGEVSTLSSQSAEPARINLEGEVAEYGSARVDGSVHAWHPTRQTNINLSFRNLQIPEYSPYTVNFAGRKIAGGTMDLDLDYSITDNQLDGENNLLLHDLKLGEKMASSEAMDLPLDLAIALLQDSDGVIDLTLPVTGDVGNPQFDFGKVIKQAVGKAITSVVTAPFSFLASLVGADSEELGQVEFSAGRTDLSPPQRERINKLREALNQRPQLVLELAGPFNKSFDSPPLKRAKAEEALQQKLAEQAREISNASLTSEANQDIVEAMFTSHYPEAELATVKAHFTDQQSESTDEPAFDALAYRNHLAEKVIEAQPITDSELKSLANARAETVREALVNADADTAIAADRVRILEPKKADSPEGERVAMEVSVSAE